MYAFTSARVFSNWRPSQNTVFHDVKPTFSFFASIIFSEKTWKLSATLDPEKSSRKGPNWDPKWTPNCWKLRWGNLENHQNGETKQFFEGSIFWWFFGWPKNWSQRLQPSLTIEISLGLPPGLLWGERGAQEKTTQRLLISHATGPKTLRITCFYVLVLQVSLKYLDSMALHFIETV